MSESTNQKKDMNKNQTNYFIKHNGSGTYMVIDNLGDCLFATDTLRKATNFLNRAVAQGS